MASGVEFMFDNGWTSKDKLIKAMYASGNKHMIHLLESYRGYHGDGVDLRDKYRDMPEDAVRMVANIYDFDV